MDVVVFFHKANKAEGHSVLQHFGTPGLVAEFCSSVKKNNSRLLDKWPISAFKNLCLVTIKIYVFIMYSFKCFMYCPKQNWLMNVCFSLPGCQGISK